MKIRKPLFAFFTLVLLCCSGCRMISLGYNNADWLLRYWINDYTDFNEVQKEQIHLEVDKYWNWHRKEALPGYIAFLKNIDAAVNQAGGMTGSDVTHLRNELTGLYHLTAAPMIRPAAHILATLDNEQIAKLADTFAERNLKQRKKQLEGTEQDMLDARAERHVELVGKMVGYMSIAQEKRITELSLHIPFASRAFIEQRETKQARLIALLRSKADEDRIAAFLRQWLTAPETFRTPQQQQVITAYENAMNDMTIQIVASLTTRQKQHLSEEINSYIDDFSKLYRAAEAGNLTNPTPR